MQPEPTTFEWKWYVTADGVVFEWNGTITQ
jgi:hypothetical protein|uniref:Uncharacterized protein n=1 Tax=viral metagenome TaxID=1070528 RepID=A0A6C0BJ39_9ZZZZ